jgi:hypothetical protein
LHCTAHSAHGTPPRPSASSGYEVRVSEIDTAEARASRNRHTARMIHAAYNRRRRFARGCADPWAPKRGG